MTTYKVAIKTGEEFDAGTWSYVYCTLIGEQGTSHRTSVNRGLFGTLKEGSVTQCEIISDRDLGPIYFVELEVFKFFKQNYWLCSFVTVETPEGNTLQFPCYRWLESCTIRIREGTAKRYCDDLLPKFQSHRQDELQAEQMHCRWNEVSSLPKSIDAQSVDDLPMDLKFSCAKEFDFDISMSQSFIELNLKELEYKFEHTWTKIEDFDHTFWNVKNPTAVFTIFSLSVFLKEHWKEDWVFGHQFLNGFNPVLIEKYKGHLENFPVTDAMVKESLGNSTLKQEIQKGNLYLVNYQILDGIPANVIEGVQQYIAAPICLLHFNQVDHMVPIAIQLKQTPGKDNPIFLPSDGELDWLLAKMWVRSLDFQHFELVSHLLRTHLIAETFSVATLRHLPAVHPVYKLLVPHIKYTIHINTIARSKLIGSKGYVSQVSLASLFSLTYQSLCLPDDLEHRGVTHLKGYFYKDDGLSIWSAILDFVTKIVKHHYQEDEWVEDDTEVQAWINDINQVGFEGTKNSGFPTSFQTKDELCKFLTMIIFNCSAQHAALNNGQYDWGSWVPNSPCSMRKPPPTEKGKVTMEHIMESLPNVHQACLQMAILWILNHPPWEMRKFGDYKEKHFTEDKVQTIINEFQDKLKEIDRLIQERNEDLVLKYETLQQAVSAALRYDLVLDDYDSDVDYFSGHRERNNSSDTKSDDMVLEDDAQTKISSLEMATPRVVVERSKHDNKTYKSNNEDNNRKCTKGTNVNNEHDKNSGTKMGSDCLLGGDRMRIPNNFPISKTMRKGYFTPGVMSLTNSVTSVAAVGDLDISIKMVTYKVAIGTGEEVDAGTWSYVYCTLIRERSQSHKTNVNRWLSGDLMEGSVSIHTPAEGMHIVNINFIEAPQSA
ncbi:polyunsaturated fatty acid 5-lipoxygenase-like [Scyliorhinus canicula]|uniref:polyunsaturated fatty acid 5-lipoxygenase-like n=1 Tax=Scyliorhinus canicula TaxID=7830 RepID=UPI0018F75747|nr:polyunsaturated fatty acid 5-lipoxygenase-like [Scyliorhinus canicula]